MTFWQGPWNRRAIIAALATLGFGGLAYLTLRRPVEPSDVLAKIGWPERYPTKVQQSETGWMALTEVGFSPSADALTLFVATDGSDANDGATRATALRSIWKATDIGNKSGRAFQVFVAGGVYGRRHAFNNGGEQYDNLYPARYEASGGIVVVGPFVDGDEGLEFSVSPASSAVFSARRNNVRSVFDLSLLDKFSVPTELAHVATINECAENPGTWTSHGEQVVIHRTDGEKPEVEGNTRLVLGHNNWVKRQGAASTSAVGFCFFGSALSGAVAIHDNHGNTHEYLDCQFIGAGSPLATGNDTADRSDGVQIADSSGLFVFRRCEAMANAKDGFNAHWSINDQRNCFVITEQCRSRKNGKYSPYSSNGITGHGTVVWIDVAGDYAEDHGGEVRFVDVSRLAAFGSRAAFDNGDGGQTLTSAWDASGSARFWLWECEAEMSRHEDYALVASGESSEVHKRDFRNLRGTVVNDRVSTF